MPKNELHTMKQILSLADITAARAEISEKIGALQQNNRLLSACKSQEEKRILLALMIRC